MLPPAIADARVIGSTGYVLVTQPMSGFACPGGSFYLLLVTAAGSVKSNDFGTCREGYELAVREDAWVMEQDGPLVEEHTTFTAVSGRVVQRTRPAPVIAAGPQAGDVRALLAGKAPSAIVGVQLADSAVRGVLTPALYGSFRGLVLSGPETEFKTRGNYLVGWTCRAHDCGSENWTVAFGPGNRVFMRQLRNGRQTYFGQPSADLRRLLATAS